MQANRIFVAWADSAPATVSFYLNQEILIVLVVLWGVAVNHGHVPHCGRVASPTMQDVASVSKRDGSASI